MPIEAMPDVLRWTEGDGVFQAVQEAYVEELSDALGKSLAAIKLEESRSGEALVGEMRAASPEGFLRVLTAPETSEHLFWQNAHGVREVAAFLDDSFRAEAAREGRPVAFSRTTWTALGDVGVSPGGDIIRMPQVEGLGPLDFGSPHAAKIDLSGADRRDPPSHEPFTPEEQARVIERLSLSREGIARTGEVVAEFVEHFNKVLIPRRDPESPRHFASGSSGQYIGRSFLANPHEDVADEAALADAMVHEGIHALLYMQERKRPWVFDPALHQPVARVVSPWSGNHLPLRPFLQACFVWYGLLHFWCLALNAGAFDRDRAQWFLARALNGFLGDPLEGRVADYAAAICPDLLGAVREMQAQVNAAFLSTV